MDDNIITFYITCEDKKTFVTLNKHESVDALKQKIFDSFGVPTNDQIIKGWHLEPAGNDSKLNICARADVVNCLIVERKHTNSKAETLNLNDDYELLSTEIEVVKKLKVKLPDDHPLQIGEITFQDAVFDLFNSAEQKKALLLYLHNAEDMFSQIFLTYLYDTNLSDMLNNYFIVVGWDIEDSFYNKALSGIVKPYEQLASVVENLLSQRQAAAIGLLPDDGQLQLFFCLKTDIASSDVLLQYIQYVKESISSKTTMEDAEIKAIRSLEGKLGHDTSFPIRYCTLADAVNFICTSPFNERKPLLLYLHNSAQPLSQLITNNLEGELGQILNTEFLVLGWDVEETEFRDALTSALNQHIELAGISDFVTKKLACALVIVPINGTIAISLCLKSGVLLKEAQTCLKGALESFSITLEEEKQMYAMATKTTKKTDIGSEEMQKLWAEMMGDRDYVAYEYNQQDELKRNIGYALSGPPQNEDGDYDDKVKPMIQKLYSIIKAESDKVAEFKDHVEISMLINCFEPLPSEKLKKMSRDEKYNAKTDFKTVPIFIIRKCRGSANPCQIVVDDIGRVYSSWTNYLTNNQLPECEMIVPLNGRYQFDDNGNVRLERHRSPACGKQYLQVGDIVSTVGGLTSGAVFVTAATISTIAVAPAALVAAGVVGAAAGIWGIGRSIHSLTDRVLHRQTINLTDREARGAYLNILAGTLGFAGAGTNMVLTQLIARGANVGQGATIFANTVGLLNIGAGGASLLNSGYDVFDQWYNENQTPSMITIVQLSSSVLFFGHAVYNFRLASTMVKETQARVLQEYQDSLRSNRHRATFKKLMKETIRVHGDETRGRAETIATIRSFANKDEVFAALTRNNKSMNKAGLKFSASNGELKLGGMSLDIKEFVGLNKKQTENFLSNFATEPQASSTSVVDTGRTSLNAVKSFLSDIKIDLSTVDVQKLVMTVNNFFRFCSMDTKNKIIYAVHYALQYIFSKDTTIETRIDQTLQKHEQVFFFLRSGMAFFSQLVDDLEKNYKEYEKTKDPRYYSPIFRHANVDYAARTFKFFEEVVNNSYSGQSLKRWALEKLATFLATQIARLFFDKDEQDIVEEKRNVHSAGFRPKKKPCKICGGYYFNH